MLSKQSFYNMSAILAAILAAAILDFILRKTAANFTEISWKHVSAASDRNIIKNRV